MRDTTPIQNRASSRLSAALLACGSLILSSAAAHAQLIYPTGSVYAAGTVYPNTNVQEGNIAGGYFGNGSGKTFDLAVTNSTGAYGSEPVLSIFYGNGDGTFQAPINYSFNTPGWTASGIQAGLSVIYAGPLMTSTSVDLVSLDDYGNLFLIPGNGDGTFGTPVNLNQVAYGFNVFPDPNGSGLLDLVTYTSSYNSSTEVTTYTVTVLTNKGSGSFTPQTLLNNSSFVVNEVDYLNIPTKPTVLLVGANATAETSILAGTTWSTPAAFNLNLPASAASVDYVTPFMLNGNLGFAANSNGVIYVWLGNAQGGFSAPRAYDQAEAIDPVQLGTADLNGDGIPDLVVLGGGEFSTAQYIYPALMNSSGELTFGTATGPGVYGVQFVLGDINEDGHPDVTLMQWNQGITVLLNQGNGGFPDPPTTFAKPQPTVPPSGSNISPFPTAMATADFNNDQLNDVAVVDGLNSFSEVTTNSVAVFLNQGNGILGEETDYPVGNQPVGIAVAPVNGNESLFVLNQLDQNISFLQGDGHGGFATQQTFPSGGLNNPYAIAAGTIDTSGFPGIVAADENDNLTVFTYSTSETTWTAKETFTPSTLIPTGGLVNSIALQDINGDGNLDLVVTLAATCGYSPTGGNTLNNGYVLIYPGKGDGTFGTGTYFTSSQQNWNPGNLTIGSLTGQSTPDVVVLQSTLTSCPTGFISVPSPVTIFSKLTGTPQETDLASPLTSIEFETTAGRQYPYASIADANGDGIPDLVLAEGGLVAVFPGTNSTAFGTPSVQVASTDTEGMATGSFFTKGTTAGGHDLAMASTAGVAMLQSLLGKGISSNGAPYADFSPVNLDFQVVTPGSTVTQAVVLSNIGTSVLTVPILSLQHADGSAAPEYTVVSVVCGSTTDPPNIALSVNASCTITVAFSPTYGGAFNAEILFNDNAQQSNVTSTAVSGFYQQIIPLTGTGAGGTPIEVSPATLPALTLNTAFLQSFSATGGSGGYTFTETGALPTGVTFQGSLLSGTPTKSGSFPITVTATDSSNAKGSVNLALSVACPQLAITPNSETLPPATIGLDYSQSFIVHNTNGAFSWSIDGSLPTGLAFTGGTSAATTIGGEAKAPTGNFSIALAVTDSAGCFVENNYLIPVANPLTFKSSTLPPGTVGVPYQFTYAAAGGTPPYTYLTLATPPGLTLNGQTGALSGTPKQSGTFTITVLATDSTAVEGIVQTSLLVNPALPLATDDSIGLSDAVTITISDVAANESMLLADAVTITVLSIVKAQANEGIAITDTIGLTLVPLLTWQTPASISYGTPLGGHQLNATTTVPGTFAYSPAAGAVLPAGSHKLAVTFTPNKTTDYTSATASVELLVTDATLTITANNAGRTYGTANPTFTGSVTGAKDGDSFTETFTTAATLTSNPGTYPIVPSVTGSDLSDYTVVTDDGTFTISKAPTTVTVTTSNSNANLDAPVTFTATVQSQTTGAPTGLVQFMDGSALLATASLNAQGVATLTTSSLTPGTHVISANYKGDINFNSATNSVSMVVTAPNFSLTASPPSVSLKAGQTASVTITLTPVGGYTGTITLSCGNLPSYVSCAFKPTKLIADGSNTVQTATLTIATAGPSAGSATSSQSGNTIAAIASLGMLPSLGLGVWLGWRRRRTRGGWLTVLGVSCVALALSVSIGCGFRTTETRAGTYTLTITGAASDSVSLYTGPPSQSIYLKVTISD